MSAQREVWGRTLTELAKTDDRIAIIDGDLANSTKADLFAADHPDRFFEAGIAEQNMVGIAFGLTTAGYRPWLSSFGVFLTHRALDPVRMLVSQTKANVKIAGAYSGLLNGRAGKTHQDIEDFAIMRAMPNMTVIAPADDAECARAVRWATEYDGPVYIRIARDAVPPLGDDPEFVPGVPRLVSDGAGPVVISTGVQTARVAQAVQTLRGEGVDLRHLHLPTLKPLDIDAFLEAVGNPSTVVTYEEHSILGGLGGLVAEIISEHRPGIRVVRLGLDDRWSESGDDDFLLEKYGLSPARAVERIRSAIAEHTR